jgi:hypothetical protein
MRKKVAIFYQEGCHLHPQRISEACSPEVIYKNSSFSMVIQLPDKNIQICVRE